MLLPSINAKTLLVSVFFIFKKISSTKTNIHTYIHTLKKHKTKTNTFTHFFFNLILFDFIFFSYLFNFIFFVQQQQQMYFVYKEPRCCYDFLLIFFTFVIKDESVMNKFINPTKNFLSIKLFFSSFV